MYRIVSGGWEDLDFESGSGDTTDILPTYVEKSIEVNSEYMLKTH